MQIDLSEKRYIVGVDPSFINCGVCRYDPATNEMLLFTGDWFEAINWIGQNMKLKDCVFVLENPALDSAVFLGLGVCKGTILQFGDYQKKVGAKEWPLPEPVKWEQVASQISIALNMATKVGESKSSGKLMAQMLAKHNVPVIQVAPTSRDRADKAKVPIGMMTMPTKTTRAQFETLTGFKGMSNEHNRDAATLVFGKDFKWIAMMLMRGLEDKAAKTRQKSRDNRQAKAAQPKKEIPKDERKFFNVVGNGEPGQRIEKVDGKFVFVND